MKIFVTGGTGFVGSALVTKLIDEGHKAVLLVRGQKRGMLPPQVLTIEGDPMECGPWYDAIAECDGVINLAGSPIFTQWNKENRRLIRESRVLTTKNVVKGLSRREGKDTFLINASAVGFYGPHRDAEAQESTAQGNDFLSQVAAQWESEAQKAQEYGVQVMICRIGVVLGREGGALQTMLPFFRAHLGSPLGSGKQWFPWIHLKDLISGILFLMDKKTLSGPFNCTAPGVVRNDEYSRILSRVLNKRSFAPAVPSFALRLLMGQMSDLILKGRKAPPVRLLEKGFTFEFPELEGALRDILG